MDPKQGRTDHTNIQGIPWTFVFARPCWAALQKEISMTSRTPSGQEGANTAWLQGYQTPRRATNKSECADQRGRRSAEQLERTVWPEVYALSRPHRQKGA